MVTKTLFTAFLAALLAALVVFPLVCNTACDRDAECPMGREHSNCGEGTVTATECSCCPAMTATPGKLARDSEFPSVWKLAVSPVGEADPVGQEFGPDHALRPARALRYRFVPLYTLHSAFLI